MKTEDVVQLGALAVIGYLAWQKFGKPSPSKGPTTSTQPYVPPVDFGVTNPDDSSWGDASPQGITLIDQLLTAYL